MSREDLLQTFTTEATEVTEGIPQRAYLLTNSGYFS
jgi:hypothetical protein